MMGGTRRIQKAARIILGLERAGRNATVFPDDVFLVSYPRSGNTWLRFLVGNLIHPETPVTFANIEAIVPSIYVNRDVRLRALPRPRVLKSHEAFFGKYRKVIYILRDPRDIAVSYYHYQIKYRQLPPDFALEGFVPLFIEDNFEGLYGPWADHVMSWLAMRDTRDAFLLLRYEDLMENPERELPKVAVLLGIPAAPERVRQAIERSSANRMSSLEKEQSRQWVSTKKSRQDIPFVRAAGSGQYKSALSAESVRLIEAAWGTVMLSLGYELAAGSSPKELSHQAGPLSGNRLS
jgi:hypothetical protein